MSNSADSLPRFRQMDVSLEERVEDLLNQLTLEEKFLLCSGYESWYTHEIPRLGIPAFKMTDGPHGVAPHSTKNTQSTYFPTAISMAASWNPALLYNFGQALGEEVRDIGFHMLLGPGVNITRTPMNGRTFEYMSEDPYLNRTLAVQTVKGIQSKRIAACVKHYACNNQDYHRFSMSSEVDERTLQEIYLPTFKACVQEADTWGIMGCYNKINGVYGCANTDLIQNRLMNQWHFRGFVVSDWGATKPIYHVEDCINAGLSLEMPKEYRFKMKSLQKAYAKGKFKLEILNENIRRLLRVMFLVGIFDDPKTLPHGCRNTPEHIAISRKIAEEAMVLLKNENKILPLDLTKLKTIAVIGANADKKMSIGGGSSQVNAPYEITPLEGIRKLCGSNIAINSDPKSADAVIIVTGLNHNRFMDAEGMDRKRFELPQDQIDIINNTIAVNPKTIVVLISGSPIGMEDWIDKIPGVVEAWYGGMEAGGVIADLLFGKINPSGKLPLTFPKQLFDSPAHKSKATYPGKVIIPGLREKVQYAEGIFVGYRHFDNYHIKPRFPFGHGLSYTDFEYSNLKISAPIITPKAGISIECNVKNCGSRTGAEVVQLYIGDLLCSVPRPVRELKRFQKIVLQAGEAKTVKFDITIEDLRFYHPTQKEWLAENGDFQIEIGASSADIRLTKKIIGSF